MRTRPLAWAILALPALLAPAACGGGGAKEATTTTASTLATTTTLPAMPADFDWWAPAAPVSLGHGWTIGQCTTRPAPESKGEALCLDNKDGRQATLEHFRFTAPADGSLSNHAAKFLDDFRQDRKAGCGEGYDLEAEPVIGFDGPDGPAKRYGFIGGYSGAPKTERTVQWAAIRGPALVIVTISGYDPGSCIPNTGQGTLRDLDQLVPALHALVVAAGLPPLTP